MYCLYSGFECRKSTPYPQQTQAKAEYWNADQKRATKLEFNAIVMI